MNLTVYLHPERLLIASWALDENVPVLHGYRELHPDAEIELQDYAVDSVHIVLHSSDVLIHWFPIDANEDLDCRRVFEASAWFGHPELYPLDESAFTTGVYSSSAMRALVYAQASTLKRRDRMIGASCMTGVDLDLDIQAALASTSARRSPWLLLGRRSNTWHAIIVGPEHQATAHAMFPNDGTLDHASMVYELHRTMEERYGSSLDALMLFGDVLTSDDVTLLRDDVNFADIKVARLQPFKRIRSLLDETTEQRLLRRAHVVAPIAGTMLAGAYTPID